MARDRARPTCARWAATACTVQQPGSLDVHGHADGREHRSGPTTTSGRSTSRRSTTRSTPSRGPAATLLSPRGPPWPTSPKPDAGANDRSGRRAPRRPVRRSFSFEIALIGLAALVLRVVYIVGAKRNDGIDITIGEKAGDQYYYSLAAEALAEGRGFVVPWFDTVTLPAADHPPLTALVAAPASLLPGWSVMPQRLTMAVVGAVAVVIIGYLGRHLGGRRTGLVAGGLAAVAPALWINDGLIMSESLGVLTVSAVLLSPLPLARPAVGGPGCRRGAALRVRGARPIRGGAAGAHHHRPDAALERRGSGGGPTAPDRRGGRCHDPGAGPVGAAQPDPLRGAGLPVDQRRSHPVRRQLLPRHVRKRRARVVDPVLRADRGHHRPGSERGVLAVPGAGVRDDRRSHRPAAGGGRSAGRSGVELLSS